MADEFKWVANKQSLVGTPLEDQFPNLQGLNTNTLGFGFNGWPKSLVDLDVTNYEVVNTYDLEDLVPFFWNWYGFSGQARAEIPLEQNSANKADVDLNISGTYTSDLLTNNDPKDRINGVGFSYNPGSLVDNFALDDLEDGIENPEYDPNQPPGPDNRFWLREPFEAVYCESRARFNFNGMNRIYRCFSGGNFIGYSFKDLGYVYAKASLVFGGTIDIFDQKLIGYYGLIEDKEDLIYSYDADLGESMQALATVVTNSTTIDNGNTSITVTKLESTANYTHPNIPNTPEGNESYIIGISGKLSVTASLGSFTYHTY